MPQLAHARYLEDMARSCGDSGLRHNALSEGARALRDVAALRGERECKTVGCHALACYCWECCVGTKEKIGEVDEQGGVWSGYGS